MLSNLKHSLFFKQLQTMLTGTLGGQLIMLAVIPVMARLFTPAEYAAYAIVVALSGITAAGATLRYELSIVLPQDDAEADKMTVFSLQALLLTTITLAILLIFTYPVLMQFEYFSKNTNLASLLFCWPVFHLLLGWNSVGNYLLTRQSQFKRLAAAQVSRSITTASAFLITGFLQSGSLGLILSSLAGLLAFGTLVWLPNRNLAVLLSSKPNFRLLKKYRNFPLYSLPMGILNTFSLDLLLHLLNLFTTPVFTGLYAKAYRVVNMPLNVLTLAFGAVFYKKLNSSKNKINIYNLAFLSNLLIAALVLTPLLLWGEELFALFLGEQWRIAGRIAALLFPLTVCCHAAGSVSQVFDVLQKNQAELIWQILYLAGGVLILWSGSASFGLDNFQLIKVFALFGALAYLAMYATGLYLLIKNRNEQAGL